MIDLHLHLDGSMRPSTVRELLEKDGLNVFDSDEDSKKALTVSNDCKDLNEYLRCFDYPIMALKRPENVERAVFELGEDLYKAGVTYGEIRFAPLLSAGPDLNEDEVTLAAIKGAFRAENATGIKLGLILCCMRGTDHEHNFKTIRAAKKHLGDHVCAVDLAGAEALYGTECFSEEFELAKSLDIPFTIHAGEAAGPESIWKALEFGAKRIGHGIRAIEDATLVDYLARYEIPLEVCPTSNLQTRVFGDSRYYPLKELLEQGVHATLNTDNMTVSNTNLKKERKFVLEQCDLTMDDIELMEQYSLAAAFLR